VGRLRARQQALQSRPVSVQARQQALQSRPVSVQARQQSLLTRPLFFQTRQQTLQSRPGFSHTSADPADARFCLSGASADPADARFASPSLSARPWLACPQPRVCSPAMTTSKLSKHLQQQPGGPGYPSRWQLARDVSLFQLKLFLDGLKDLVLVPLSLIAALLGILGMSRQSRRALYTVMRMGQGFDDWVDLYGQANPDKQLEAGGRAGKLDHYVDLAEKAVIDAHARSKASADRMGEKP
jgi:hypothetical protein